MSRIIPQRDKIEVDVHPEGFVRITQSSYTQDDAIILVHPDDVDILIEHLKDARQELLEEAGD